MKKYNCPQPLEHICVKCKKNEDTPKEKKPKIERFNIIFKYLERMTEMNDSRKFYDRLKKKDIKFSLKMITNEQTDKWSLQFTFYVTDKVIVDEIFNQLNMC